VAFDVLFRTRPPLPGPSGDLNAEQDLQLAAAMARARRVLIAGKLELSQISPPGIAEKLVEISPPILDAALAMRHFRCLIMAGASTNSCVHGRHLGNAQSADSCHAGLLAGRVSAISGRCLAEDGAGQTQLLPATVEEVRSGGQLQATCLLIRK